MIIVELINKPLSLNRIFCRKRNLIISLTDLQRINYSNETKVVLKAICPNVEIPDYANPD